MKYEVFIFALYYLSSEGNPGSALMSGKAAAANP